MQRFADFELAYRIRPVFLPVAIVLPAERDDLPIKGQTEDITDYDIIVTGAITDGEDKRINFYREIENKRPLVKTGNEPGLKISLDAIAGKSREAAGITGVQDFIPFCLRAGDSLALEIFKDEDTDAPEKVNTVFLGYRVYDVNDSNARMTAKVKDAVLKSIGESFTEENRWSAIAVKFDESGNAIVETPKSEEPLLVVGFRTTFTNALVNLGFSSETKFSVDYFPIWALANETGNVRDNYNRLASPIPLAPNDVLYLSFRNTIDGVTYAEDGQIELLTRKP